MEPTHAADRYLSSESTRPARADHSARRVPTFLRCRSRGGCRTRPARRPAHRGPPDIPRASDPALRSRPMAGNRQRLVERDLRQRLPDAGDRHPRRPEHQRRESARAAADLRDRTAAGADQPATPDEIGAGFRASHSGLVRDPRADESHPAAVAAAWADREPAQSPVAQPCSQWSQPRAADAAQATTSTAAAAAAPAEASRFPAPQCVAATATTSPGTTAWDTPRGADRGRRRVSGQVPPHAGWRQWHRVGGLA